MGSAFLEQIPPGEPWTIHVRDEQFLEMAEWAITQGGPVSIGLGDDPYANLGLPTNADLVGTVADLADKQSRPAANLALARDLLRFT